MPTYSITGPDGTNYSIDGPEGATKEDVVAAIQRELANKPQQAPQEGTAGFIEAAKGSTKRLLSSGQTALTAPFGPEEAAQAGLARQEAITERPGASLEQVKEKFQEGIIPGVKEVISQVPGAIGEYLPQGASMYAGFQTGFALTPPVLPIVGPFAKPIGGAIGAIGASFLPQVGSNIERQAQEDIAAGRPVDIETGKAFATGAGQAALDYAGFVLGGVGKLLGVPVKKMGTEAAEKAAAKLVEESFLKAGAKGTGKFLVSELPTEVGQQMLERYQAGLSLTTPDAINEYSDVMYQVGLLGPIGGVARVTERSSAKGAQKQQEQQRDATIARVQAERERIDALIAEARTQQEVQAAAEEAKLVARESANTLGNFAPEKSKLAKLISQAEGTLDEAIQTNDIEAQKAAIKELTAVPVNLASQATRTTKKASPTDPISDEVFRDYLKIGPTAKIRKVIGGEDPKTVEGNVAIRGALETFLKNKEDDSPQAVAIRTYLNMIPTPEQLKAEEAKRGEQTITERTGTGVQLPDGLESGATTGELEGARGLPLVRDTDDAGQLAAGAGRVDDTLVSEQNRDRSSPASIVQMNKIATEPMYERVSTGSTMTDGAPIVTGPTEVSENRLGKLENVVAADNTKLPTRYAVVEAAEVLPSHNADGTRNQDYSRSFEGLRAVAGNGRIAGLQEAYRRGNMDDYRAKLLADESHGIDPAEISNMKEPVLIRLAEPEKVPTNIAEISNISGTAPLSMTERASQDAQNLDLSALEQHFSEDGEILQSGYRSFVAGLPTSEQADMISKKGEPTLQAINRLDAAIFKKAYDNDELVNMNYQEADPEARNVMRALTQAAPQMARLAENSEYDIRPQVAEAAEMVINARRRKDNLDEVARQMDITVDPISREIFQIFADNPRSSKVMSQKLRSLAGQLYEEAFAPEDMFGGKPKRSIEQIIKDVAKPEDETLLAPEMSGRETVKGLDKVKDGKALLNFAAKLAKSTQQKSLANALRKVDGLENVKFTTVPASGLEDATGYYDPASNTIYVSPTAANPVQTILHELYHAASVANIDKHVTTRNGKLTATTPLGKNMIRVFEAFNEAAQRRNQSFYAQENIKEFFSEANTDPTLKNFMENQKSVLKQKPAEGRIASLWSDFVNLIKAMFGIPSRLHTMLDDVISFNTQLLGTPTETAAAPAMTASAFKRWFGNSKVVNEDGSPKVVYHGTAKDFDTFKKAGWFGTASTNFFTDNPHLAGFHGARASHKIKRLSDKDFNAGAPGVNIMPVYLSMQNPLVVDYNQAFNRAQRGDYKLNGEILIERAKKGGHDGLIIKNMNDAEIEGEVYVTFRQNQIKSAVGNVGTYSPETGNILYAKDLSTVEGVIQDGIKRLTDAYKKHGLDYQYNNRAWAAVDKIESGIVDRLVALGMPRNEAFNTMYGEVKNKAYKAAKQSDVLFAPPQQVKTRADGTPIKYVESEKESDWQRVKEAFQPGEHGQLRKWMDTLGLKIVGGRYTVERKALDANLPAVDAQREGKVRGDLINLQALNSMSLAQSGLYHGRLVRRKSGLIVADESSGPRKVKMLDISKDWLGLIERATQELGSKERAYDMLVAGWYGPRYAELEQYNSTVGDDDKINIDEWTQSDRNLAKEAWRRYGKELADLREQRNIQRRDLMKLMVDSGLYTPEKAQQYLDRADYVALYRVPDEEHQLFESKPFMKRSSLLGAGKEYRLVGSKRVAADPIDNYIANMSWMMQRAIRNNAAIETANLLDQLGVGKWYDRPMTDAEKKAYHHITINKDGIKRDFQVDDPNDLMAFQSSPLANGLIWDIMGKFSSALRTGITAMPQFVWNQVWEDPIRATFTSGNKAGFMNNIKNTWKSVLNNQFKSERTPNAELLNRYGIIGQRDTMSNDEVLDMYKGKNKAGWKKSLLIFERMAQGADLGTRESIFENAVKELMAEGYDRETAEDYAALRAHQYMPHQQVGMSRSLAYVRRMMPFINPPIQGWARDIAAARGRIPGMTKEEGKKALYWRVAKYAMFTGLYTAMMSGDDDYENQGEDQQDNNFFIGGARIPVPQEIRPLKVAIERGTRAYVLNAPKADVDSAEMAGTILRKFWENIAAFNPMPAAVRPAFENFTNFDLFSGLPVVSAGQLRKEPYLQYNDKTSEIAKIIGAQINYSPIKIDKYLKGYLGYLGQTIGQVSNYMSTDRPAPTANDIIFVGSMLENQRATGNRGDFYDLFDRVTTVKTSANELLAQGDVEAYREYVKENKGYIAIAPFMNELHNDINELREYKKLILSSNRSPEEKREALDRLTTAENNLLNGINDLKRRAVEISNN